MSPHFGSRDAIGHVTIRSAVGGGDSYKWPIDTNPLFLIVTEILCIRLSDKHIPIVTALDIIWGSYWVTMGVMPFFGKAPLAAAEGRCMRY